MRETGTLLLSRAMPTKARSAAEIVLRAERAPEVREAVMIGPGGRRLAGSPALTGPAAELLTASDAPAIEVVTPRGGVYAVRQGPRAIVAVTTRAALPALILRDLRAALSS